MERYTEDDSQILITHIEIDIMLAAAPQFMRDVWSKLPKTWCIGGCLVYQCAGSGIATRLNYIREYVIKPV